MRTQVQNGMIGQGNVPKFPIWSIYSRFSLYFYKEQGANPTNVGEQRVTM